jgi:type I restriction enzyme, S subunit
MMKHYDSYKDSGIEWIGEIPSHWEVKRLKRMTKIKRGSSPRPIDNPKYFDENGQFSWVRISDVTKSERYLISTEERLSELGCSLSTKIYPNQLFLSIAGSVGKPIISKIECCIHDGFVWFENLNFNSELLWYQFNVGTCFSGLGKMGTQLNLNSDTVGMIHLPVPPLSEQEHIVSYLDDKTTKIDKLIELMLKEEKLLIESIVSYLFVNRIDNSENISFENYWFQSIPQNWKIVKLKELFKVKDVKNNNERLVSVTQENGVVFRDEQKGDVMNPSGDTSNYKLIEENDFVISLRSSEGGFEVSFIKGLVSPVYTVLEPKLPIDTIFYKYLFKSENFIIELNRYIKGIRDGKNIHFNDVRDLPIPYNPNLSNSIIETHKQIFKKFDKNKQYIELLKEYRKSLISEVVTGKIKVVSE